MNTAPVDFSEITPDGTEEKVEISNPVVTMDLISRDERQKGLRSRKKKHEEQLDTKPAPKKARKTSNRAVGKRKSVKNQNCVNENGEGLSELRTDEQQPSVSLQLEHLAEEVSQKSEELQPVANKPKTNNTPKKRCIAKNKREKTEVDLGDTGEKTEQHSFDQLANISFDQLAKMVFEQQLQQVAQEPLKEISEDSVSAVKEIEQTSASVQSAEMVAQELQPVAIKQKRAQKPKNAAGTIGKIAKKRGKKSGKGLEALANGTVERQPGSLQLEKTKSVKQIRKWSRKPKIAVEEPPAKSSEDSRETSDDQPPEPLQLAHLAEEPGKQTKTCTRSPNISVGEPLEKSSECLGEISKETDNHPESLQLEHSEQKVEELSQKGPTKPKRSYVKKNYEHKPRNLRVRNRKSDIDGEASVKVRIEEEKPQLPQLDSSVEKSSECLGENSKETDNHPESLQLAHSEKKVEEPTKPKRSYVKKNYEHKPRNLRVRNRKNEINDEALVGPQLPQLDSSVKEAQEQDAKKPEKTITRKRSRAVETDTEKSDEASVESDIAADYQPQLLLLDSSVEKTQDQDAEKPKKTITRKRSGSVETDIEKSGEASGESGIAADYQPQLLQLDNLVKKTNKRAQPVKKPLGRPRKRKNVKKKSNDLAEPGMQLGASHQPSAENQAVDESEAMTESSGADPNCSINDEATRQNPTIKLLPSFANHQVSAANQLNALPLDFLFYPKVSHQSIHESEPQSSESQAVADQSSSRISPSQDTIKNLPDTSPCPTVPSEPAQNETFMSEKSFLEKPVTSLVKVSSPATQKNTVESSTKINNDTFEFTTVEIQKIPTETTSYGESQPLPLENSKLPLQSKDESQSVESSTSDVVPDKALCGTPNDGLETTTNFLCQIIDNESCPSETFMSRHTSMDETDIVLLNNESSTIAENTVNSSTNNHSYESNVPIIELQQDTPITESQLQPVENLLLQKTSPLSKDEILSNEISTATSEHCTSSYDIIESPSTIFPSPKETFMTRHVDETDILLMEKTEIDKDELEFTVIEMQQVTSETISVEKCQLLPVNNLSLQEISPQPKDESQSQESSRSDVMADQFSDGISTNHIINSPTTIFFGQAIENESRASEIDTTRATSMDRTDVILLKNVLSPEAEKNTVDNSTKNQNDEAEFTIIEKFTTATTSSACQSTALRLDSLVSPIVSTQSKNEPHLVESSTSIVALDQDSPCVTPVNVKIETAAKKFLDQINEHADTFMTRETSMDKTDVILPENGSSPAAEKNTVAFVIKNDNNDSEFIAESTETTSSVANDLSRYETIITGGTNIDDASILENVSSPVAKKNTVDNSTKNHNDEAEFTIIEKLTTATTSSACQSTALQLDSLVSPIVSTQSKNEPHLVESSTSIVALDQDSSCVTPINVKIETSAKIFLDQTIEHDETFMNRETSMDKTDVILPENGSSPAAEKNTVAFVIKNDNNDSEFIAESTETTSSVANDLSRYETIITGGTNIDDASILENVSSPVAKKNTVDNSTKNHNDEAEFTIIETPETTSSAESQPLPVENEFLQKSSPQSIDESHLDENPTADLILKQLSANDNSSNHTIKIPSITSSIQAIGNKLSRSETDITEGTSIAGTDTVSLQNVPSPAAEKIFEIKTESSSIVPSDSSSNQNMPVIESPAKISLCLRREPPYCEAAEIHLVENVSSPTIERNPSKLEYSTRNNEPDLDITERFENSSDSELPPANKLASSPHRDPTFEDESMKNIENSLQNISSTSPSVQFLPNGTTNDLEVASNIKNIEYGADSPPKLENQSELPQEEHWSMEIETNEIQSDDDVDHNETFKETPSSNSACMPMEIGEESSYQSDNQLESQTIEHSSSEQTDEMMVQSDDNDHEDKEPPIASIANISAKIPILIDIENLEFDADSPPKLENQTELPQEEHWSMEIAEKNATHTDDEDDNNDITMEYPTSNSEHTSTYPPTEVLAVDIDSSYKSEKQCESQENEPSNSEDMEGILSHSVAENEKELTMTSIINMYADNSKVVAIENLESGAESLIKLENQTELPQENHSNIEIAETNALQSDGNDDVLHMGISTSNCKDTTQNEHSGSEEIEEMVIQADDEDGEESPIESTASMSADISNVIGIKVDEELAPESRSGNGSLGNEHLGSKEVEVIALVANGEDDEEILVVENVESPSVEPKLMNHIIHENSLEMTADENPHVSSHNKNVNGVLQFDPSCFQAEERLLQPMSYDEPMTVENCTLFSNLQTSDSPTDQHEEVNFDEGTFGESTTPAISSSHSSNNATPIDTSMCIVAEEIDIEAEMAAFYFQTQQNNLYQQKNAEPRKIEVESITTYEEIEEHLYIIEKKHNRHIEKINKSEGMIENLGKLLKERKFGVCMKDETIINEFTQLAKGLQKAEHYKHVVAAHLQKMMEWHHSRELIINDENHSEFVSYFDKFIFPLIHRDRHFLMVMKETKPHRKVGKYIDEQFEYWGINEQLYSILKTFEQNKLKYRKMKENGRKEEVVCELNELLKRYHFDNIYVMKNMFLEHQTFKSKLNRWEKGLNENMGERSETIAMFINRVRGL